MSGQARIDEVVLRVPGLRAEEARRLADEVMRRVRAGLPDDFQAVEIGRIDLKLRPPAGLGFDALAERLARAVLDQIPGGVRE